MRKALAVILALALVALLATACGGSSESEQEGEEPEVTVEAEEPEEEQSEAPADEPAEQDKDNKEEKQSSSPEKWVEVKTEKEAAKRAGLDSFNYGEGAELSLGTVKAEKISYMEGVARADVPIGAVDMWICKGLSSIDGGDVSFDQEEFKHRWTHNLKGMEVLCYGNRMGEATKTIWTINDYSYAIVAHGAGGDDDYGLSVEDLDTLLNAMQ